MRRSSQKKLLLPFRVSSRAESCRMCVLSRSMTAHARCFAICNSRLRAAIILTNPIVWGGDTIIRLFDRHTLLKSYQLPLLQVLISGVSTISMNPVLVQFLMAVIGAVAGIGFYLLAADFVGLPAFSA